ncbi:hypothetical protein RUM44_003467 [Polyplax serrata]|uniref:BUB1 N-terminal domain-containing protein n=1 Tax=Polyplax serrata TaxID=468196 RepID=A0ABR1AGI8_POLSC
MSHFNNIQGQDLVSSKENIQPLRRGRDTSILCSALQAETDTDAQKELERQRNEFEIKLRSNFTNEDPLVDWCNYIHWIEQSFPKQGREGKLNVVLQKCLNKFKDSKQYMNDIRFVKLCIKYAELEDNTVELLSQIHRHGIGVLCAELYIAWAEKFAVDNCFKKANAIYERGLKCSAQPLQLLQESYQNFQAFLVHKMLNDRETFQPTLLDTNPTEQRQPYNVLQSVKAGQKDVIPGVRVGSNVIGAPGKLQRLGQTDPKHKTNTMVKIFEDTEGNVPSNEPTAKLEKIHSKKTQTKENTVKAGPWNNKKNKNVPFKVDAPSNLQFQVHQDEEEDESKNKMKAVPSTVLKEHKTKSSYEDENFANAPLFYPEPYDPTRVPMYCKEQVYAGGLEFQFEELRAIQYRRNLQESAEHGCLYAPQLTETVAEVVEEMHQPISVPKLNPQKAKQKLVRSSEKKLKSNTDTRRKTIFSNPLPVAVPEENLPNTDYSMNQTIHTKEALSEMQQLWFSKPASPVPVTSKPIKPAAKSILKPSKPCFSLYVDESCLEDLKQPEDKPLDLTFKVENHSQEDVEKEIGKTEAEVLNTFGEARKKTALKTKIKCPVDNKENYYVQKDIDSAKLPEELKVDDEDKENGIPENYCGPVGKSTRKVSGILTPAENVEIADLSDEEVIQC